MDADTASDAIDIDPADITHLPDDGVVLPAGGEPVGRELITDHPFLAVGAAMAAGYVIGRALRWA